MPRFLILFMSASLLGALGCAAQPTPPIVLGHVSDKTRQDRAGDQAEFGLRLALHELSKDSVLADALGGKAVQIRHTDTGGDLNAFEAQAVRLESINRSLCLFGGVTGSEVAALDHVQIPILTFHGHRGSNVSNHVICLGMAPARQGSVLAEALAAQTKIRRLAIVSDERSLEAATLTERFSQALTDAGRKPGARPVATYSIRFGKDPSWTSVIERLHAHDVDGVLFAGSVRDFNAWHRVFRKESILVDAEILYAGSDGDHRAFDLELDAKASILLATAFCEDQASEKITAFAKAYREAFQMAPDVHAALAYDGLRLTIEALKRSQPHLTPERVRDELLKTKDFEGLTGPLTITADRQVARPVYTVRWRNGTLTKAARFEAVP